MASLYTPNRVRELTKEREEGIRAGVASVYGPAEDPLGALAEAYTGWGGPAGAGAPSDLGGQEGSYGGGLSEGPQGLGGYGGDGYGGGDGVGGGGGDIGGSSGEGAGMFARGGVSKAMFGPKRATYGEVGPETAIFIPEWMKRPGIQGGEMEIRNMLAKTLRELDDERTLAAARRMIGVGR